MAEGGTLAFEEKSVFFALETTILYTLHPRKFGGLVGYRRGPWRRVFQLDREPLVPPSWVAGRALSGLQQSLQDRTSLSHAEGGGSPESDLVMLDVSYGFAAGVA